MKIEENDVVDIDEIGFEDEFVERSGNRFNLTGIIPVGGQKQEFNFPWHDCLMPQKPDVTAVERCVFECAMMGCRMIYIVGHSDMQPLIKSRIGESVEDPVWYDKSKRSMSDKHRIRIPIFYVPINVRDEGRRDCLGWSAIYGCFMSYYIARKVSKYVVPEKYFISFPYGVYDYNSVRKFRQEVKNNDDRRLLTSYQGQTLFDGLYASAVITTEDVVNARREFRKRSVNSREKGDDKQEDPNARYGVGKLITKDRERYTGRWFSLKDIFGVLEKREEDLVNDVDEYHNIDTWDGYREYMSSDMNIKVHRSFPASLKRQRKLIKEYPTPEYRRGEIVPSLNEVVKDNIRRLLRQTNKSAMQISKETNVSVFNITQIKKEMEEEKE